MLILFFEKKNEKIKNQNREQNGQRGKVQIKKNEGSR
jgi:hypothetical protein